MKLFAPPTHLLLYSNLDPEECARRLEHAIDRDDFSLFSFSGYRGVKPFLGMVSVRQFQVFRRGYRNIPPVLSGSLLPQGRGTQIDGNFDLELASKITICLLTFLSVPLMMLVVLYSLREHTVPSWVSAAFACVYLVGALLVPRIVRWNGLDQEREITDFLCVTLEARENLLGFESGGGR